jgi:hypothetical protein
VSTPEPKPTSIWKRDAGEAIDDLLIAEFRFFSRNRWTRLLALLLLIALLCFYWFLFGAWGLLFPAGVGLIAWLMGHVGQRRRNASN